MGYFTIHTFFSSEKSQENNDITNDITSVKLYPSLRGLGLTPEQQRARAKAIAKLDEYILGTTKFSHGNGEANVLSFVKHLMTREATFKKIQEQMKDIKNLLLTKSYTKSDWDIQIETHLNRINIDGTGNIETNPTKMSKRIFLQRIIGPSEAGKILVENSGEIQKRIQQLEKDTERSKQKSRLEQFLTLIDNEKDGLISGAWRAFRGKAGIDSEIRNIRSLIAKGDLDGAIGKASELFDGKWRGVKISNVISSDAGLANAQRAFGNIAAAEATLVNVVSNKSDSTNEKQEDFYKAITKEAVQNEAKSHKVEAERIYTQSINILPYNDPDRIDMVKQREAYINNYATFLALKHLVSDYIRKYGSKDLPPEMQTLNDMRGLHGITNFSDENAKLFKEIAILIASMAVTFGASAVAGVAAGTARGAALVARTGVVTSKIPGVVTAGKTAMSALAFTSADAAIREIGLGSDGQKLGTAAFLDNLAKNTAMFGTFLGMEKFLTSGFLKNIPGLKTMHVDVSQTLSIGNTLKLSAGDIVVLQALHAAETGKLETDWKALATIAVFRGSQAVFPQLINRFKKLPKDEQKKLLAEVNSVLDLEKNALKGFSKNKHTLTSDIMNMRAELNAQLSKPTRGDIIKIFDGSEWRYTGIGGRWQQLDSKKGWVGMDYTDGVQLTTSGLKKKYYVEMKSKAQNSSSLENPAKVSQITHLPQISSKTNKGLINVREGIVKGPDKINVVTYTGKNIKDSLKTLNLKDGDHIHLSIGEGKDVKSVTYRVDNNKSDVKYIKISGDNGFPDSFSKKPGDTLWIRGDDVYLNSGQQNKITKLEIYTPKEVRLQAIDDLLKLGNTTISPVNPTNKQLDLPDQLKSHFYNPKIGSIVELPNGTKWKWSDKRIWEIIENPKNVASPGMQKTNADLAAEFDRQYSKKFSSQYKIVDASKTRGAPYTQQQYLAKLAEDVIPAISSVKSGDSSKLKNFFQDHWKTIAIGMAEWTLLKNLLDREKTNPFFILPDVPPQDVQSALELCLLCFSENKASKIDYSRISVSGKKLDADYRIDISHRWMQTKEWKDLMNEWNNAMVVLKGFEDEGVKLLQEKITEIKKKPTVEAVKDLQRYINMAANDNSTGQDGILGPNTTKAIHEFISKCRSQYAQKISNLGGMYNVSKIQYTGNLVENQDVNILKEDSNSSTDVADSTFQESLGKQTPVELLNPVSLIETVPSSQEN